MIKSTPIIELSAVYEYLDTFPLEQRDFSDDLKTRLSELAAKSVLDPLPGFDILPLLRLDCSLFPFGITTEPREAVRGRHPLRPIDLLHGIIMWRTLPIGDSIREYISALHIGSRKRSDGSSSTVVLISRATTSTTAPVTATEQMLRKDLVTCISIRCRRFPIPGLMVETQCGNIRFSKTGS